MGLNELFCFICGVSFEISRIRTKDEPLESAWGPPAHYEKQELTWCGGLGGYWGECRQTGCRLLYRGPTKHVWRDEYNSQNVYDSDSDDSMYSYSSDMVDDPLEYDSAAEDSAGDDGASPSEDVEMQDADDSSRGMLGDTKPWTFSIWGPEPSGQLWPLSKADEIPEGPEHWSKYARQWEYEHIAGPDCTNSSGYHGDRVSALEMSGCTTIQCLVAKKSYWEARDDDEDFESNARWHLTGLSNHVWSDTRVRFTPNRHGAIKVIASHYYDLPQEDDLDAEFGIAFHPTCFELFKIESLRVFGRVDIDSLVRLRNSHRGVSFPEDGFVERHRDLIEGRIERDWKHNVGDEYLACNPIFVPGLRQLCEEAISRDETFHPQQSAFRNRHPAEHHNSSDDPFLSLPTEIIYLLLPLLSNKDIASLRLSSRAFEHLPISLWFKLVKRDYPCVFEAWSHRVKPSRWAYLDPAHLIQEAKTEKEFKAEYHFRRNVIKDYYPEVLPAWDANEVRGPPSTYRDFIQQTAREREAMEPVSLPYHSTNWYQLYCSIRANWRNLKGLQNRARIYADVMQIVNEMKAHVDQV